MEYMTERNVISFDYESIEKNVANNLKNRAIKIQSIASKSAFDIGKELKEANEELANHGNGCFEKWYRSLGFKTTKAYEYINHYNFVSSQNEESKIKMFESLPIGLQKQVSNPTANQEVVQSVLSGDVKTVKEVEELKRQLKQKDEQISNQSKTIEQLSSQEPEVREVEVEKIPQDYNSLKTSNNELTERLIEVQTNYEQLLSERREVDEKSAKYEQLTQAINQAEGKLNGTQKMISNYNNLSDLLRQSNEFLAKASALVYQDLSEVIQRDGLAKRELDFLIERLDQFLSDLTSINKNTILEGEIIND